MIILMENQNEVKCTRLYSEFSQTLEGVERRIPSERSSSSSQ